MQWIVLLAAIIYVIKGRHAYVSTACLHDNHEYCQSQQGRLGLKEPATCKFCGTECRCRCHLG